MGRGNLYVSKIVPKQQLTPKTIFLVGRSSVENLKMAYVKTYCRWQCWYGSEGKKVPTIMALLESSRVETVEPNIAATKKRFFRINNLDNWRDSIKNLKFSSPREPDNGSTHILS